MRENTDQNNTEYGQFLHSEHVLKCFVSNFLSIQKTMNNFLSISRPVVRFLARLSQKNVDFALLN